MRFNVLVATSFLVTLVAGHVIPPSILSSRDLDDTADILVRESILKKVAQAFQPKYHVPAGLDHGKPAQTYTRKEVKQAVRAARTEQARLNDPNESNRSKKRTTLKSFKNFDHRVPKKEGPKHLKPFPNMHGGAMEYPLPNKNGGTDKGPARIILQPNNSGKLKLKGVVAHDQTRDEKHQGYMDHFPIRPSINPFRRT